MRLVLDTNVVLDWLHFRDAAIAPLERVVAAGAVRLITSEACLEELRRVLERPCFGLDEAAQTALLGQYRAQATLLADADGELADPGLPVCRDSDDQKFLVLAWRAGAQCLLTRDKALLRLAARAERQGGFAVMTPLRFAAERLQPSSARR